MLEDARAAGGRVPRRRIVGRDRLRRQHDHAHDARLPDPRRATWARATRCCVTGLDHDANVAPWMLAASDRGVTVRQADIDPETCLVDVDDFAAKLSDRTRVAAFGWASNGAGTVNDVGAAGALAARRARSPTSTPCTTPRTAPIDVAAARLRLPRVLGLQVLRPPRRHALRAGRAARSATGPTRCGPAHRRPPRRGRPARSTWRASPARPPRSATSRPRHGSRSRRTSARSPRGCGRARGDRRRHRVRHPRPRPPGAHASFNVAGQAPAEVSAALGERDIFVWDGNYYALELMQRLGPRGLRRRGPGRRRALQHAGGDRRLPGGRGWRSRASRRRWRRRRSSCRSPVSLRWSAADAHDARARLERA